MTGLLVTLGMVVAVAAGLAPLILRDLRRAVARRRFARSLTAIAPAFAAFRVAMSSFFPAAVKAAADFDASMGRLKAAMNHPGVHGTPAATLMGLPVVQSDLCTRPPTPAEDARRIVRHGLADVLEWLGEDPGPRPGERVSTAYLVNGTLLASPAIVHRLRELAQ